MLLFLYGLIASKHVRGHYGKHSCEIILNLVQEVWFKDFSIFSSGGHLICRSKKICAIFVEGIMGNIQLKLF